MKGLLQDADLTYMYVDDSTSLSSKENLSTPLENYTYKWRQVLNRDKTEHISLSKKYFGPIITLLSDVKYLAYGMNDL